ncbi:uncharacterized protein LOC129728700 [Wyeomyia smithii]|uniref:uncharacterized protein LOC129728700 n=1 Tax=Wyeomyia smithii TaxID=174621 RepID=UPI002467E0B0|nr:uncharacterized protein LOC129728700 [Wyeomyia smithii]
MVVQAHNTQLLSLKQMTKGSHAELTSLLDVVEKRLESLEFHSLKMQDNLSEALIVNLVISKLDIDTRKAWEATVEHGKLPKYKQTMDFLRQHGYMLERCEQSFGKLKNIPPNPRVAGIISKAHAVSIQQKPNCVVCNSDHLIEMCDTFKGLNINNGYMKAKQMGLCFACLKRGHRTANCNTDSSKLCSCKKKHHPLMHYDEKKESTETATGSVETKGVAGGSDSSSLEQIVAKCEASVVPNHSVEQVLLATAVVDIFDSRGVAHKCRAMLDSGAMASFVSERICDLLGLHKESVNVPVIGVNGAKTTVRFKINAVVKSRTTECSFSLDCLVVPRVTGALPSMKLDTSSWPIPETVRLADPQFFQASRVDLLIGAERCHEVLQDKKIVMSKDLPLLQRKNYWDGWLPDQYIIIRVL